jgi:phospholipid transport system substrate-binding protein
MVSRLLIIWAVFVATVAWSAGNAGAHAADAAGAAAFLTALSERAIDQLTNDDVPEVEREKSFRTLLNEGFAIPAIGRFVLGRYWRVASEEERQAFLDAFEDVIVQRFLPLFAGYRGERLEIGEAKQESSNLFIVSTVISRPQGEAAQVLWRIRGADTRYQILDVGVEGVSMAITLRSEYGSFVQRQGGQVSVLVESLREKLARGAFAPEASQ